MDWIRFGGITVTPFFKFVISAAQSMLFLSNYDVGTFNYPGFTTNKSLHQWHIVYEFDLIPDIFLWIGLDVCCEHPDLIGFNTILLIRWQWLIFGPPCIARSVVYIITRTCPSNADLKRLVRAVFRRVRTNKGGQQTREQECRPRELHREMTLADINRHRSKNDVARSSVAVGRHIYVFGQRVVL